MRALGVFFDEWEGSGKADKALFYIIIIIKFAFKKTLQIGNRLMKVMMMLLCFFYLIIVLTLPIHYFINYNYSYIYFIIRTTIL